MSDTLALSVIHDGDTYAARLSIESRDLCDAWKQTAYARICKDIARRERAKFGVYHTPDDIGQAAQQVRDYMRVHVAEFDDDERAKLRAKVYTRADYMARRCTHDVFYAQGVTNTVCSIVGMHVGAANIKGSSNRDDSFNDIPLHAWDALEPLMRGHVQAMYRRVDPTYRGGVSLSDCVCLAKAAARQIHYCGE